MIPENSERDTHTLEMIRQLRSRARIPYSTIRYPANCTECGRGRSESANFDYLGGECIVPDTPCNMQPAVPGCPTCEGTLSVCGNCGNIAEKCPCPNRYTEPNYAPCPTCTPLTTSQENTK